MNTVALIWTKERPGRYRAVDERGNVWHTDQRTSSAWPIYENGIEWLEAGSLADVKSYVEGELKERRDPELRARTEARLKRLRERRK